MFTGIIENQAIIIRLEPNKLLISNPFSENTLSLGQSLAVDGCCLTVVHFTPEEIAFDLSIETTERITLRNWKVGNRVNIERGLKAGSSLDGHWVTGHIDGVGTVQEIKTDPNQMKKISIQVSSRFLPWLIEKGSIAVNGVSLTVNHLLPNGFDVMLIPHTLGVTNLNNLNVGDRVNLEFDILAKYIQRMMQFKPTPEKSL